MSSDRDVVKTFSNLLRDQMKVFAIMAACAALALSACSKQPTAPKPVDATPASPAVVTVNGKPLSQKMFEAYAESLARRPFAELSPEERDQIKENLVRVELLAQDAEKSGLIKDPDLVAALDIARLQVIQQATARKISDSQKPTEAELRAEYDTQLANMPLVEYHARHIVVSGEDVALKIIDRLKGGQDFAALAKQLSTFKETARNGGDLGWFAPNVVDPEFANAVALLKKGEVSARPVQTRMGWHVIQLLNTRDRTPPAYEAVKDRLAQRVMSNKLTKLSDDLLRTAKVEPPLSTQPAAAASGEAPASTAPAPAPAPTAPAPATPPSN
jgi:peptidyl-prolyl cis-trans isomerase C